MWTGATARGRKTKTAESLAEIFWGIRQLFFFCVSDDIGDIAIQNFAQVIERF